MYKKNLIMTIYIVNLLIRKCLIFIFVNLFLFFVFTINIHEIYGWHEELGINKERAQELYSLNPYDPTIQGWLDATQFSLTVMKKGCLDNEPTTNFETCLKGVELNYQLCQSHNFMNIVNCEDNRIKGFLLKNGLLPSLN